VLCAARLGIGAFVMRDAVVPHDPAHEAVPSSVGDKTLPQALHIAVFGPRQRGPETGWGLYPRFGPVFLVWGRTNHLAVVVYPAESARER
jgi:hypothetical protein